MQHLRRTACAMLLLCLVGQVHAGAGLVFRVSRDAAPVSYLVGTMHSEDVRVTALLDEFEPLIDSADVVAIELLPDAVTMLVVGAATLLPFDQSLRGLIGAERFEALSAAAAQLGIPMAVLDRLKPWAAAVTLGMPASSTGRFLDMQIYLHALERRRRTVGLETAAEQLAAFEDMPPAVELALLDEMVKNAAQMPTQLEALTAAYLSGDLATLDRVARGQYAVMPPAVTRWFDDALLDRRNARMLSRLAPLLAEESVFVAVGALHLGGATGLVAGLQRLGYRVERWDG